MRTKKLLFTTLSIFLIVSLLFSACTRSSSSSKDESTKTQDSAANGTSQKTGTEDEFKAPLAKFDPPIELTTVRTDLYGYKYPQGDNIDNNVVYREYEEKLGIKIKHLWVSDQFDEKRNLMIVSGDLPDFFEATPTQFQQLIEADLIADLTDVFEKYASADTKRFLNEGGPDAIKSATVNGRLMGLPYKTLAKEGVPILYIREDWVNNLGKQLPKTWAEVEELAIAFTKNDPDGNQKSDTTGFASDAATFDTWAYLKGFYFAYHAYPNQWLEKNGQLEFGGIQPEVKNALLALQRLYKEGAISPDFATAPNPYEEIVSGKAGMFMGAYWSPLSAPQLLCDSIGKYEGVWKSLPLSTIDGKPLKLGYDLGVQSYHVVNKNCKHPEAVVMLMNFWMDTFYMNTSDEVYYKLCQSPDGSNQTWGLMLCHSYREWKNVDGLYGGIKDVIEGRKELNQIVPEARDYYRKLEDYRINNDTKEWGWAAIFDPRVDPSLAKVEQYRANDNYLLNAFYGAPTKTMTEKWQTLKEKQILAYNKIITGGSIDEFDNFIKEWKSLGGDQVTAEVNEWYQKNK